MSSSSSWTPCGDPPASAWQAGAAVPESEWEPCDGLPAPTINTVLPDSGTAGTTVSITIHGSGFTPDTDLTVS